MESGSTLTSIVRSLGLIFIFFPSHLRSYKPDGTNLWYRSSNPIPKCDSMPTEHGFSQEEKRRILKIHNEHRREIRFGKIPGLPLPKHMPDLVWDEQLASEAQRWADLCPNAAKGTSHPPEWWQKFPYSQNVAWGYSNVDHAIKAWFDEYKPYVEAGVDPLVFRGPDDIERIKHNLGQIGHFTAMINAKSKKLGCGRIVTATVGTEFKTTDVCDYSPVGNIVMYNENGQLKAEPAYEPLNGDQGVERNMSQLETPDFPSAIGLLDPLSDNAQLDHMGARSPLSSGSIGNKMGAGAREPLDSTMGRPMETATGAPLDSPIEVPTIAIPAASGALLNSLTERLADAQTELQEDTGGHSDWLNDAFLGGPQLPRTQRRMSILRVPMFLPKRTQMHAPSRSRSIQVPTRRKIDPPQTRTETPSPPSNSQPSTGPNLEGLLDMITRIKKNTKLISVDIAAVENILKSTPRNDLH